MVLLDVVEKAVSLKVWNRKGHTRPAKNLINRRNVKEVKSDANAFEDFIEVEMQGI